MRTPIYPAFVATITKWFKGIKTTSSSPAPLTAITLAQEKQAILESIADPEFKLKNLSERWRKDRDVVLAAVKKDASNWLSVSTELCADREITRQAILSQPWLLIKASDDWRQNEEIANIILSDAEYHGCYLEYFHNTIKDNKTIVGIAVRHDSEAFPFASERLRGDEDILIALVAHGLSHVSQNAAHIPKFVKEHIASKTPENFKLYIDRILAGKPHKPQSEGTFTKEILSMVLRGLNAERIRQTLKGQGDAIRKNPPLPLPLTTGQGAPANRPRL